MRLRTIVGGEEEPQERLICAPTDAEVAQFGRLTSERMCGNCRKFNLQEGQRQAMQGRFWARIRHEHGWSGQSRWTGPVPNYGLCEEYGDAMVFMFASADETGEPDVGCEFWRPGYGKIIRASVRRWVGL